MNPLNQQLREIFFFSSTDLRANHTSELSPRQQARLKASGASIGLSLVVFMVVMLGTLGVIAIIALASGSTTSLSSLEFRVPLRVVSGMIGLVVVFGYLSSRNHMATTRAKTFQKAEGVAQPGKIRADAAYFEIKIGRTKIRLVTQEQLEAFQIGVEYRVFYIPGPVPNILSAEVIGTEAEAEQANEPEIPLEQDIILQRQRAARPVVIALAGLALGIPLVGVAASSLPGMLRPLAMLSLLAVAILFIFWASQQMAR